MKNHDRKPVARLALAALGIVYGDIGTSPLYTVKQVFHMSGAMPVDEANVLGVISTILWALIVVVGLKYVVFIMRADNEGEGGIVALLTLAASAVARRPRLSAGLVILGLCGASLFYGDAVITPAISVLSAVEGLEVAEPSLHAYVVPIATAVLIALFVVQIRGTGRIARVFGPVMLVWFAALAAGGAWSVMKAPRILMAFNPLHAARFLASHGAGAFVTLGAIVLAVTGAEALYADMGQLGRRPIRIGWVAIVFPALALDYLGQGALLATDPHAILNPLYLLFPRALLYPMIALASAATIIASQAVISGAFSMTRQAMHVGFLPHMPVVHTSGREPGQIYIAPINWLLFIAVMASVLGFRSSTDLGAAYGIAVTGTMVITTVLGYFVLDRSWRKGWLVSAAVIGPFLLVDLAFLGSNLLKIVQGGWYPLAIAAVIFFVMTTWRRGRHLVVRALRAHEVDLRDCLEHLPLDRLGTVKRTGVFLMSDPQTAPHAFVNNLEHNGVVHQPTVFLSVEMAGTPFVRGRKRREVERLRHGFYRVCIRFGFMERADALAALEECAREGLPIDLVNGSFFVSAESIGASDHDSRMGRWRTTLFAVLTRLSGTTEYLNIPVEKIVAISKPVRI